ncbi:MAG: hypothetical protein IKC47_00810 [Clostridia bacterium]|nr:hypothetical protein [Clostridia bacterium]
MHSCLTYFYVDVSQSTNFNLQQFCTALSLTEDDYLVCGNSNLRIGVNSSYDVDLNVMARATLACIWQQRTTLVDLKNHFGLVYYLVRVPQIYTDCDQPNPLLSLDADVVAFLHETGTLDDLDYYVY